MPGGLSVWRKPANASNPVVTIDDIEFLYRVGNPTVPESQTAFIPQIPQSMAISQVAKYPYCIASLFNRSGIRVDVPRILGSPNGEQWFEIFRLDQFGSNFTRGEIHHIVGPVQNDPQKRVYATIYDNDG